MQEPVVVSVRGAVATVTLNRPEIRNAISDADCVDAIVKVFTTLERDSAIRVAILTGAGAAFSAGGNLKRMGGPGELGGGEPADTRVGYARGIQRIPLMFAALELPVIAAVNGPAIGAGCDLACMCDIRIAAQEAVFAESFVKLGLVPGDGGAWLLQRIVGFAKAAEMTLTGASLSASEALACGLVSRVVAHGELLGTCEALADQIAQNPPEAVRMSKKLLQHAQIGTLESTLALSASFQAIAHTTAAHRAAIASFQKRK
jgi:enoyl-CoA hydratase/carnithine racemase